MSLRNISFATKSGRHIKGDRMPEAIKDYLTAYSALNRYWGDLMGTGTPPAVMPQGYAFQGRQGGGRRGGGSTSNGTSSGSGCCGKNAMWWWNEQEILDTGTPPGVPGANMVDGNPAPLVDMIHKVYPNNNIIFDKGCAYFVPANNGVAQGQRQPLRCGQHPGHGFGYVPGHPEPVPIMAPEEVDAKMDYRNLWNATNYAIDSLNEMGEKGVLRTYDSGLARAYQGRITTTASAYQGRSGGGYCASGNRGIKATFDGKSVIAIIDTGTVGILAHGSASCIFDPDTQAIQIPGGGGGNRPPGGGYYTPAYYISQRVKLCLTNRYTVAQSYASGKTVTYDCQSGQVTQGDVLGGKEWGGPSTPTQSIVPAINPNVPQVPQPQKQAPGAKPWYEFGYNSFFGLGVI